MSLFANRAGSGASVWAAQRRLQREREAAAMRDCFADLLAQHSVRTRDRGGDIAASAAKLGRSAAWGRQQFKAVCASLGWQAV